MALVNAAHNNDAGNVGDDDFEYDLDAFTCLACSDVWHVNGPKFAGQPTAGLRRVPYYMQEKGLSLPVFMKRSLTKKDDQSFNKLLGWEYVGNYRCISDPDLVVWESAANIPRASKNHIAKCYVKSANKQSDETYGKIELDNWRARLEEEERAGSPLYARARELGFARNINYNDLAYIIVELDEFYKQEVIEFVEYDERIYKYCSSEGPTSKNSRGNMLTTDGGTIAKARDWYDFANQQMLV